MTTEYGTTDGKPSRWNYLVGLVSELADQVPSRIACPPEAAEGVVALWPKWRRIMQLDGTLDRDLQRCQIDLSACRVAGWGFDVVACTFGEAMYARGKLDEARAFLDWALQVPPAQVQESTRQRLEDLRQRLRAKVVAVKFTARDRKVLAALPAEKYAAIARAADLSEDSVKACMRKLKKRGLVDEDREGGYRRTAFCESNSLHIRSLRTSAAR